MLKLSHGELDMYIKADNIDLWRRVTISLFLKSIYHFITAPTVISFL